MLELGGPASGRDFFLSVGLWCAERVRVFDMCHLMTSRMSAGLEGLDGINRRQGFFGSLGCPGIHSVDQAGFECRDSPVSASIVGLKLVLSGFIFSFDT